MNVSLESVIFVSVIALTWIQMTTCPVWKFFKCQIWKFFYCPTVKPGRGECVEFASTIRILSIFSRVIS